MLVKDVMTRNVITIDKNRKLSDAIKLIEKNRISRVVVTDSGKVCGIVTEKDLIKTLGSSKTKRILPSTLHVSAAMRSALIAVREDAEIREAALLMVQNKVSSLPVIDGGQLTGIVTTTDILKILKDCEEKVSSVLSKHVITVIPTDRIVHARRLMLDNEISGVVVVEEGDVVGMLTERDLMRALGRFKKLADRYQHRRIRNMLVGDVMTQDVKTLEVNATIGEAAKLMLENSISGIPVTEKGKLAGMVTKADLAKLLF
ncbi:MAG: CBS domain-containing protein [Euryarchaeota archaeon]|nr:CBS domain-containing protein [Euryarchaeota archaeon]